MSTLSANPPFGRPALLRWAGSEFDRAVEMGLFGERRVELIDGQILEKPPMNSPHAQAVRLATYALLIAFPPPATTISVQCPMELGESRPLPDLAVVVGTPREVSSHPTSALLIVEVSDSMLEFDREDKAPLYAAYGIADYWIVNLVDRCVEVHGEPYRRADGQFEYRQVKVVRAGETVSPLAAPNSALKVSDLLPTPEASGGHI